MLFQCKNINLLLNSDLRGENIYGFLEPHRQLHKNFVEIWVQGALSTLLSLDWLFFN
jgi:hypothetical protein